MTKRNIPNISEISKFLKKESLLPIYFLCGEDQYSIELAADTIEKAVKPYLLSDFDNEAIAADKNQNLQQVLDLAYAFPFGGEKKLLIIKNFEKINDKKVLIEYINNPAVFTIMVIINSGKITDYSKEPYSILLSKKYFFEASIAKGEELIDWVLKKSKKLGLNFTKDNAQSLIEIVGEEKSLIDVQLEKLYNYLHDKKEITFEEIKKISSPTKEFSIFDLQDSIGKGDKARSVEIAYNLLESGVEIVFVINMLAKFVLTIAQIIDLVRSGSNDNEGAKLAGVSWGYYVNCKKASYLMNDERLLNASRALLNADLAVKTTSSDPFSIILILLGEMMGEEVTSAFNYSG